MSMLEARDNEQRSYLELVDALRRFGASPLADIHGLWRRIVFNILISNTDDHLRNHGFLYSSSAGWQLSPAYDLNPVPIDIKPRILSTAIDFQDSSASLDLAFEVSAYFELSLSEAREIVREVASAISFWRKVAASFGIFRKEIERMSSAFEHEEQVKSLKH
jgi:serine/threonine-protein kinase HipA